MPAVADQLWLGGSPQGPVDGRGAGLPPIAVPGLRCRGWGLRCRRMSDTNGFVDLDLGTMICGGCGESTSAWASKRRGQPEGTISIDCRCGYVNEWTTPAT